MISGKSLGPLVSELGLSVQKFSFIVHMMAVSVASLCPLSSWAGIQVLYLHVVLVQYMHCRVNLTLFILNLCDIDVTAFPANCLIGLCFDSSKDKDS